MKVLVMGVRPEILQLIMADQEFEKKLNSATTLDDVRRYVKDFCVRNNIKTAELADVIGGN